MRALRPLFLAAALMLALAAPAAARAQAAACPCTVFAPTDAPLGDALQDQPVEVGMKFRSDEDGYITALRFYKQPNNTGTHVGHLWSSTGQQLAEVEFTNETASGWQEADAADAGADHKDTTYVTSYHSSHGPVRLQPRLLLRGRGQRAAARPGRLPRRRQRRLQVRRERVPRLDLQRDQLLGRRRVRADAAGRTRGAPLVSAVSPAGGATRRAGRPTKVTATFDEALDPPHRERGLVHAGRR